MTSMPPKTKAAPAKVAAFEIPNSKTYDTLGELQAQDRIGKAAAMWLHNHVLDDLAQTQRAFDRQPAWRSA